MSIFDGTHRAPNSKEAARSFRGGARYEPKVKLANWHWEAPPKITKPEKGERDLTGIKFGRFEVIGKAIKDWMITQSCWIVRCSCGDYETRKSKAILNPKNYGDRCHKCRAVAYERKIYEWRTTGVEIDQRKL